MVKLNRIYTRTGDDGSSGLVDGSRLPKSHPRFIAIGEVDEANSAVGWAAEALDGAHREVLRRIENEMFDLGADLATPASDTEDWTPGEMTLRVTPGQVGRLESEIDALNADLAPLTSFILPGGGEAASRLFLARAVVRRAERAAVAASEIVALNPAALAYLNRLSDHLFVLARAVAASGEGEVLWRPGATRAE